MNRCRRVWYLDLLIPIGVLVLLVLGAVELSRRRFGTRSRTPLSAAYANEVTAFFVGSKRIEMDQRDSWSMMREQDAQGAPSGLGIDLDRGTVVLRDGPDRTCGRPDRESIPDHRQS